MRALNIFMSPNNNNKQINWWLDGWYDYIMLKMRLHILIIRSGYFIPFYLNWWDWQFNGVKREEKFTANDGRGIGISSGDNLSHILIDMLSSCRVQENILSYNIFHSFFRSLHHHHHHHRDVNFKSTYIIIIDWNFYTISIRYAGK